MKTLKIFGLLTLLLCLAACSKDNDSEELTPTPSAPTITFDNSLVTNGLSFTDGASEKSITFTTDADWTLSITETRAVDWCIPSATSGIKGTATIKFSVKENAGYDNRKATVTIKAGSTSKTFVVSQKQKDALILSKSEYTIPSEGETIEVVLQSNVKFDISIDTDWISQVDAPATRGLEEHKLYFKVEENTLKEERSANITITDTNKNLSQIIEVTQEYARGSLALMVDGPTFNQKLKEVSRNTNIKSIDFIVNDDSKPTANYVLLSTSDSEFPIYATNNNGKVKIFTTGSCFVFNADCSRMFSNLTSVTSINFDNYINTSNVMDMKQMFYSCDKLLQLNLSAFDTSKVIDMSEMFLGCESLKILDLPNFVNTEVKDMSLMFAYCKSIESLDLSSFYTPNVTNMSRMFEYCESLTSLDLSSFTTSNVTNMSKMFPVCSSLQSLDLSNFDTSNVISMKEMFASCKSITSLDLSNFKTSNVTNMTAMFDGCSNLTSVDLSGFDTSNVTDMSGMFGSCSNLQSLNLSNFNTAKVVGMGSMFFYCWNLTTLDLSNFDTANVANMNGLFWGCSSLSTLNLSNFTIKKTTNCDKVFLNTASASKDCVITIPEDSYQWVKDQLTASYFTIIHP